MPDPKIKCAFYRTGQGREPVRDWLRGLDDEVCKAIGRDILSVQWRWPISKPLVDAFGGGLYEVRTSAGGGIYRVLFCITGSTMWLLEGFAKKTQKTPARHIDLARLRQREVESE